VDFYTFVAFFSLGFATIGNKTSFLENGGKPCPQVGMRIGAGRLSRLPGISDNGNKISYGVVYGHIDKWFGFATKRP
jgi:hypothetical protein